VGKAAADAGVRLSREQIVWALERTTGNEFVAAEICVAQPAARRAVAIMRDLSLLPRLDFESTVTAAAVRKVRETLRTDGVRQLMHEVSEAGHASTYDDPEDDDEEEEEEEEDEDEEGSGEESCEGSDDEDQGEEDHSREEEEEEEEEDLFGGGEDDEDNEDEDDEEATGKEDAGSGEESDDGKRAGMKVKVGDGSDSEGEGEEDDDEDDDEPRVAGATPKKKKAEARSSGGTAPGSPRSPNTSLLSKALSSPRSPRLSQRDSTKSADGGGLVGTTLLSPTEAGLLRWVLAACEWHDGRRVTCDRSQDRRSLSCSAHDPSSIRCASRRQLEPVEARLREQQRQARHLNLAWHGLTGPALT
jgi:hypothetical protein